MSVTAKMSDSHEDVKEERFFPSKTRSTETNHYKERDREKMNNISGGHLVHHHHPSILTTKRNVINGTKERNFVRRRRKSLSSFSSPSGYLLTFYVPQVIKFCLYPRISLGKRNVSLFFLYLRFSFF